MRSQKKPSSVKNHDAAGIICILVSGLSLVCLVFPFLFGVAGEAVRGFLIWLFGLSGYAVFGALLAAGVMMVRNRPVSMRGKYVFALFAMAISAVSIIHLATSSHLFGLTFAEYSANIYDNPPTAGGIILGLIVYPVATLTSIVAAYMLFGAAVILFTLIFTDFKIFSVLGGRKESAPPRPAKERERGYSDAIPEPLVQRERVDGVGMKVGGSLYLEDLSNDRRARPHSEGGKFSESFYAKPRKNEPKNENPRKSAQKNSEAHRQAAQMLFGDKPPVQRPNSYDAPRPDYGNSEPIFEPYVSPSNDRGFNRYTDNRRQEPPRPSQPTEQYNSESRRYQENRQYQDNNQYRERQFSGQEYRSAYEQPRQGVPRTTGTPDIKDYTKEQPQRVRPPMYMHGGASDASSAFSRKTTIQSTAQAPATPAASRPPEYSASDFARRIDPQPTAPIQAQAVQTHPAPEEQPQFRPAPVAPEPTEPKARVFDRLDFPYVPQPVQNFNYSDNPNPIINGDTFGVNEKIAPEPPHNQSSRLPREDARTREQEREETISAAAARPDPVAEQAPKDFTGRYTVLPPKDDGNNKEQFEAKVRSFDELYPNLRGAGKRSGKNENQIPIEEYASRSADPKPTPRREYRSYVRPPVEMLNKVKRNETDNTEEITFKAQMLEEVLAEFKVRARVVDVTRGPAVTRFELQMPPGISVKVVEKYAEDIAYKLASSGKVRIEAPIAGKTAVGIEVPNAEIDIVGLRDIIESPEFKSPDSPATIALGRDIANQCVTCNLFKMPHLLIAGATGSGKSVCLNSLIVSLIYKASPEDLRLILIDPKRVELAIFADIPHLLTSRIVNDVEHAVNAFDWAINEMERRYHLLNRYKVKDIREFNDLAAVKDKSEPKLPYIVLVVDELADLMYNSKREIEDKIRVLAQKARAAGIHLVIATQRPSVDIITGTIKANLPSRIAFAVTSSPDSITILNQGGAESLLGRGDMLFAPFDKPVPTRIQGAYVSTPELKNVVDFVKEHNEIEFDADAEAVIFASKEEPTSSISGEDEGGNDYDSRLKDAARIGIDNKQISISLVQRKLYIGYARAARIIDQLEKLKFISPFDGSSKARQMYMTPDDFKNFFDEDY